MLSPFVDAVPAAVVTIIVNSVDPRGSEIVICTPQGFPADTLSKPVTISETNVWNETIFINKALPQRNI